MSDETMAGGPPAGAGAPDTPTASTPPTPAAPPARPAPRPEPSSDPAPATGADERPAPTGTASDDGGGGGEPSGDGAGREPSGEGAGEGSGPGDPARKRRRRGSRGGRRRKKPAGAGGSGTPGADGDEGDDDDDADEATEPTTAGAAAPRANRPPRAPSEGGRARTAGRDDETDPAADRGLTTEDVAAGAAEDAGLRPRVGDSRPAPPAAAKPRIGDSRPAPAAPAAGGGNGGPAAGGRPAAEGGEGSGAPRKRRRRGGRGRGRGGSGQGGGTPAVVGGGIPDDGLDLEDLDEETLERRRGKTRKGRPTGRYTMVVSVREGGVVQMAVLEGRVLVEHYVSRPTDDATSIDGNIYLGKVQNVLPGMEAAFVDIGTPKNGVLYRGDVSFDKSEVEESQPRIETLLRNGQSVVVQVTKNPIGAKGARLTQEVSLAGRFVVMVPGQPDTYGISKRLPDDERKRLRKVLDAIRPTDAGLIVRTAAEGATAEELQRDLARLSEQWRQISQAAQAKPPRLLYREPSLVVRVIREEFNKEYRAVVIDDPELYADVKGYVEAIAPELADRIELYEDPELPVFERFHVHEQLHKALDRKVWLPSGGSLIIERTEALTVIDVNTGKNVGRSNLEETVFQNNLEAAEEVARQLRLRDIGGIIVIDFIDMEIRKNRDEVVKVFREALARDKTRTQVFEISELGLVEMTRKRISEGLVESFSETCPTCAGRGFLVDHSML